MTRSAGFTLVELVIAMTVMALLSIALYGVISLGATTAGAGERRSEQARRFRIATSLIVRQLRSAAPMYVAADEEDDDEPVPYFLGESDRVDFVTASPQGPYSTGFALVSYWTEDGTLMMSETPYFLAFGEDGLGPEAEPFILSAPLLYNVKEARFEYQRSDYESDEWEKEWDANEDERLPAGVRITIEPDTPDGPHWDHEVPLFVGVFNEIAGEDDFRRPPRRVGSLRSSRDDDDDDDIDDDIDDDADESDEDDDEDLDLDDE